MRDFAAIGRTGSRGSEGQTGLALLDATVSGTKAKDLETTFHHLVIGREEALQQLVRTCQTYLAGLSPNGRPIGTFLFLGPTARRFLLTEGIDLRYGARCLNRAIERTLVNPLSNLTASGQIGHHDRIRVMHNGESRSLTVFRETAARETWKTDEVVAA